jgi:hypothetical protein
MNDLFIGMMLGIMLVIVIWLSSVSKDKLEKKDPKEVIVRYKDKSSERVKCTEWETGDNVIRVIDSNTDEYIIKEINLKEIKSIGFVNSLKGGKNE